MPNPLIGLDSTDTAPDFSGSIVRQDPSPSPSRNWYYGSHAADDDTAAQLTLADFRVIVRHLIIQTEALKQENQELRKTANAFGDLAERLSNQLRQKRENRPSSVSGQFRQPQLGCNDRAQRFSSTGPRLKQFTPANYL